MIEVRQVITKKEQKEFLDFPLNLYNNNPYFVPPIYGDEKKIFKKNYIYYDTSEAVYYNAYKDGKIVGRISAILQKSSNEKWNQKRVRFTRFDCINDQEVANKLFEAVEKYAKEKGMEEVVGPLGFSDLEREGLLIEGFDYLSTYEEQYNFDYYQKLIENNGYSKEVDWIEHRLFLKQDSDDRLEKYCDVILKRFKLHLSNVKSIRKFIKKYKDQFFTLLDTTYEDLYGTVPFTDNMKKLIISNFKLVINMNYLKVIVDENDKVVCFGLGLPAIGEALQKSKGHLYPSTLIKLLKEIKKPTAIDLCLIGVLPEYANKGVSSSMLYLMKKEMETGNIKYMETNLNLEDNHSIQQQWNNFDHIQHKRRRSFIKKI